MKTLKWRTPILAAAMACAVVAQPALAQTDAPVQSDEERNEGLRLYYTAMECAQSATFMSVFDESLDAAGQQALKDEGTLWLGLAEVIGKPLGMNYETDFANMAQRSIAEIDLLGTKDAAARYAVLRKPCKSIYDELSKPE